MNAAGPISGVGPGPTLLISWRSAEIAQVARALCARGRKANLEGYSYG
jgi:hypothetical protein